MGVCRAAMVSMLLLLPAVKAAAATTVPGSANPNLAGRADGYTCCNGDSAPQQAAAPVVDVEFASCDTLHFSASGRVSFVPGAPAGNNPDGDDLFDMTNFGDGISAPLEVRSNALFGVFLGAASPTGTTAPSRLNFNSSFGFSSLSPALGQVFFIGDGLTSDTKAGQFSGSPQSFVVPPGAKRLFLGTGDGSGWYNNAGSFSVETTKTPNEFPCGDATSPIGISAGDALHVLRSAVGSASCLECICDADGSGGVAAGDALTVLRRAVGNDVELRCPCCESPTTTTTTTTTTMAPCLELLEPCTVEGTPCCNLEFRFCAYTAEGPTGARCANIPGLTR